MRGDFRRPNLAFEVLEVAGPGSEDTRLAAAIEALDRAGLRARTGPGRAIVYCSTRKKAEDVATRLKQRGFAAGHYHAGRTALARERAQTAFARGRLRVLVATNAFGMGIDYPDVRVIVHYQAPGSVEAYYQEAGRAGRDGEPGHCLLLYGAGDLVTQRRIAAGGKRGATVDDALAAVARFATTWSCRQQMLCEHFTGVPEPSPCTSCDVCLDPTRDRPTRDRPTRDRPARDRPARDRRARGGDSVAEPAAEVLGVEAQQLILAAIGAHGRAVGKGNLAKALRGSRAKPVVVQGLDRLSQHGALAAFAEDDIAATIEALVRDRRLVRRGRTYPTVALPSARGEPRGTRTAAAAHARRGRDGSRASRITVELDRFRNRMARQLRWKPFMVFQRHTILAIDRARPDSLAALARIPGMGASRVARFGDELLAIVRRYAGARDTPEASAGVRDLFSELARD